MNKRQSISILGCGWLGLPLAKFLVEKGYTVKGSTTSSVKLDVLKSAGILPFQLVLNENNIEGDITAFLKSDILILNIPPKRRPDIVDFYTSQINLILRGIGSSTIRNILFISSTSVYQSLNGTVNEETPVQPEKASGIATFKAEQLLRSHATYKTTILRLGGLIGPERDPGRFLAGKTHVPGADNPVNLIHLNDCIGIIHFIVEKKAWGETFVGCSPDHPAKKEFYTKAAKRSGLIPPLFDESIKSNYKLVDGSRVSRVLGYSYRHPIL